MKPILFTLPENEDMTKLLAEKLNAETGESIIRKFPDGETYVRILSEVKGKNVLIISTLHYPDTKLLPLYFLSKTAQDLGAKSTMVIAPYLAYMRQDKVFHPGEGVTSAYFGEFISHFANALVTIDPHLHRRSSLSEIYTIPNRVMHAADNISNWIKHNIDSPVLIGPDAESEQWVSEVAKKANAPFTVLHKERLGDEKVNVSIPHIEQYKNRTPVIVDDIISTGHTMMETIKHLKAQNMKAPICIGIHGVFADNAYNEILQTGASEIITCNTIPHPSNKIDVSDLLVKGINELLST